MSDKSSPFIGEKVKLRELELTDIPSIMQHWNTYETRIGLGRYIPESVKGREEWVKKTHEEAKQGSGYTFAIIQKETDEFLGTCSLKRINRISRGESLSIAIHNPENHDKGYGTDSVKLLLEIGFDVLNLHRIELHVFDFLERAIHIYKKLGFQKVGVRRESSFIAGEYRDDLIMDILEREYRKKVEK